MIPSISYWAFPGGLEGKMNIEEAINQAAAAGFEGIELAIAPEGELTHQTPAARCKEIIAAAKKAGIKIVSTASGAFWGMSLTDSDPAVRKKALAFLKDSLRVTADLKAGAMLVVPGCVQADFIPGCKPVPYDFVYKTALQQLKDANKVAKKLKVQIGVENVWNKFLLSPLEMLRFIKEAGVKSYYDVGNTVAFGTSADWVRILGKNIIRVHFKEYKKRRLPDGSMTFGDFPEAFEVPLGEGDVDYPAVLRELRKSRYKGPVTYEYLNFSGDTGAVRRCAAEIKKVLAA